MEWWTILLLAFLCSMPAVVLLWSAFHVGKSRVLWAEDDEDEQQPQPISANQSNPKGHLAAGNK